MERNEIAIVDDEFSERLESARLLAETLMRGRVDDSYLRMIRDETLPKMLQGTAASILATALSLYKDRFDYNLKPRIFVAEDEAAIRAVYKEGVFDIYSESHDVEMYEDGSSLVGAIGSTPFDVDLILTDESFKKGGVFGMDIVRKYARQVPTILCSSHPLKNEVEKYGAHFVSKPFNLEDMGSLVKRLLTKS